MCKWEWLFVFTDAKTNKYPLKPKQGFCDFFKDIFFTFFLLKNKQETILSSYVG